LSFTLTFTPTLDTKSSTKEYISRGIQFPFLLGFNRNEGTFLLRGKFFGGNIEILHFTFTKYLIVLLLFILFFENSFMMSTFIYKNFDNILDIFI